MNILSVLQNSFLFRDVDGEQLSELIRDNCPTLVKYKRGDIIYSSASSKRQVGFVISGQCEIRRERIDTGPVLLNSIGVSESFGILSVFSDEEFPTRVVAARGCEIAFFSDGQIRAFIAQSEQINLNLINFLAGRIVFLNKKIATFSGSRITDRLAAFLLCEMAKQGRLSFPFSYVKCGEEINAGRASVYRAVASLEAEGLIKVTEKRIQIIDRTGLERITNI